MGRRERKWGKEVEEKEEGREKNLFFLCEVIQKNFSWFQDLFYSHLWSVSESVTQGYRLHRNERMFFISIRCTKKCTC